MGKPRTDAKSRNLELLATTAHGRDVDEPRKCSFRHSPTDLPSYLTRQHSPNGVPTASLSLVSDAGPRSLLTYGSPQAVNPEDLITAAHATRGFVLDWGAAQSTSGKNVNATARETDVIRKKISESDRQVPMSNSEFMTCTIRPRTKTRVRTEKKAIMNHTGMRSRARRRLLPVGSDGDSVFISPHIRSDTASGPTKPTKVIASSTSLMTAVSTFRRVAVGEVPNACVLFWGPAQSTPGK